MKLRKLKGFNDFNVNEGRTAKHTNKKVKSESDLLELEEKLVAKLTNAGFECSENGRGMFDCGNFDIMLDDKGYHVKKKDNKFPKTFKFNELGKVMKYIKISESLVMENPVELFPVMSYTGKPFHKGYYVDGEMFAKGEEKERDSYLFSENVFTKKTPNWESLIEEYPEDYRYSEWELDIYGEAYDEKGNAYQYDNKLKRFILIEDI